MKRMIKNIIDWIKEDRPPKEKKYKFRQHVPAFFTGFDPWEFGFNTKEEFFEKFESKFQLEEGEYYQLSKNKYYGGTDKIMRVWDGGKKWWVLGHISPTGAILGLDEWVPVEDPERIKPTPVLPEVTKHIQKPYTVEEITEKIQSGDYNAEQMMQHLLFHVSKEIDP
jgi:hypothetical protein